MTTDRRRTFGRSLLVVALAVGGVIATPSIASAAPVPIRPGALMFDQNGKVLQMHGLGMIKVGTTYYGFGEYKVGASDGDAAFEAITCYTSTNLANWTYVQNALTVQPSGDIGPNRVVERPKVIYNDTTKQYVMYLHVDSMNYSDALVGVATSSTPCGPYTYRNSWHPQGNVSRDIGLFKDTDGKAYLMSEDRGHGLQLYQLSSDYLSTPTPPVYTFPTRESPALAKVNGRYFLFGSNLTYWNLNQNDYVTSTSLSSGWTSWANFTPAGTNTCGSQSGSVIPIQGSQGTTYMFAGDRWNPEDLGNSPMVWQPLEFDGASAWMDCHRQWTIDTATGQWADSPVQSNTITGVQSGRCIDLPDHTVIPSTQVQLWDCNGGTNQRWTLNSDGTIVGLESNLCLEAYGEGTTAGTIATIYRCNGGSHQKWTRGSDGSIKNVKSGLCLDAPDHSVANGTKLVTWSCNGGSNQRWTVG
jgi:hypothetical protein